jgi:hypothetical protein
MYFTRRDARSANRRPRRRHAAHRVLNLVLDADRAVDAENRLGEELLEAARRRLRHDEQSHAQNRARQAHDHGPLLRREEAEGDAEIGRHHAAPGPA